MKQYQNINCTDFMYEGGIKILRLRLQKLNFYIYEVCLKSNKSNGTGSINVLFYLTSKFYNMSPLK